jgi:hypothetical protein
MEWLVWSGALLSILGLIGLIWCILTVWRAKRRELPDEDMRATLRKVVPLNMGALLLSAFGLMMVVVGVMLG